MSTGYAKLAPAIVVAEELLDIVTEVLAKAAESHWADRNNPASRTSRELVLEACALMAWEMRDLLRRATATVPAPDARDEAHNP